MIPAPVAQRARCDIVFLCTERELDRERAGMWEALQPLATVRTLPSGIGDTQEILDWWRRQSPDADGPVLLWPDPDAGLLPRGLADCPALTACWHIDSFSAPRRRAEQARLFDLTFVFHPDSVRAFRDLGVPDVRLIPHAVRARCFLGGSGARTLDVAFVGSLAGAYTYRRSCLAALTAAGFAMNDYRRSYDYAGLARVYQSARIGVNIPQDPYLRDANLRCFEVMAAETLLLTPANSELRQLGFVPGTHYLEFASIEELCGQVRRMLADDGARMSLAAAARNKVMAEFTYDQTAASLVRSLEARAAGGDWRSQRLAPTAEQRTYLRYFARRGQVAATLEAFRGLATARAATLGDARDVAFAMARALRARVHR